MLTENVSCVTPRASEDPDYAADLRPQQAGPQHGEQPPAHPAANTARLQLHGERHGHGPAGPMEDSPHALHPQ